MPNGLATFSRILAHYLMKTEDPAECCLTPILGSGFGHETKQIGIEIVHDSIIYLSSQCNSLIVLTPVSHPQWH